VNQADNHASSKKAVVGVPHILCTHLEQFTLACNLWLSIATVFNILKPALRDHFYSDTEEIIHLLLNCINTQLLELNPSILIRPNYLRLINFVPH
jgi:hypothetical protein